MPNISMDACPVCTKSGRCFARMNSVSDPKVKVCKILTSTYEDGRPCPFQKPERNVTNNRRYYD